MRFSEKNLKKVFIFFVSLYRKVRSIVINFKEIDNFYLLDRHWVLRDIKNEFYIINDGYQIFKSDNW